VKSASADPISRYFVLREIALASNIYNTIQTDIKHIMLLCEGKVKQNNYTRTLLHNIIHGTIPQSWKCSFSSATTLEQSIADFVRCIEQLKRLNSAF